MRGRRSEHASDASGPHGPWPWWRQPGWRRWRHVRRCRGQDRLPRPGTWRPGEGRPGNRQPRNWRPGNRRRTATGVPPADPGRRLPRRRFLAYWLASLVPVVAIGLIVGLVARGQLQDQGLAQAKSEGAIIDQALLALVGPDQKVDLTAAQESALVDELRAMTSEHRFYGLRLHGSGMDVDVGGPFPRYRLSAAQLAAVRRGEEVADVQPVPGGGHQAVAV